MKLSILDQSVSVKDKSQDQTINDTLSLSEMAEKMGYHRFWVSEHHNHPTIIGTAPEVLMAAIAVKTQKIRIGSAGIMLPHYSSFKVAEQFRVLNALAPNRIDLGLGRAPGSDGRTALALNPNNRENSEHFPSHVRDLISWVKNKDLIEGHPFGRLNAQPCSNSSPEVWMLGTSNYGAQLAAYLGIPYCYAHFITDGNGMKESLEIYQNEFRPSDNLKKPKVNICVWGLMSESNEKAKYLFSSRAFWKIKRNFGQLDSLSSPDESLFHINENGWKEEYDKMFENSLVGDMKSIKNKIFNLIDDFNTNELTILTWCFDENERVKSYKYFSETFV